MKLLIIHLAIGVGTFLVGVSIELVFTANRCRTHVPTKVNQHATETSKDIFASRCACRSIADRKYCGGARRYNAQRYDAQETVAKSGNC